MAKKKKQIPFHIANGCMCSVLPHILLFKARKPIGKTDIYNVLPTGTVNLVGS